MMHDKRIQIIYPFEPVSLKKRSEQIAIKVFTLNLPIYNDKGNLPHLLDEAAIAEKKQEFAVLFETESSF